ncbi:MAG: putative metal-binding motif-containing protein, partial [Acidobacteriota bacterium]|nr:putative metal-binding motif-containing protein [Acidobacteriota bacterium]
TDRRINDGDAYAGTPSLAWTGEEFLAAWGGGNGPAYSILFARLDAQGQPLAAPLYIPAGTGPYARPSLVWTGARPAWIRDEDALVSQRNIRLRLLSCCTDADADGTGFCDGDRDDGDPDSHPGAVELCDGRDNDFDGTLDEGCDTSCQAAPLTALESLGEQRPLGPAVASRGAGREDFVVRGDATRSGRQLVVERGPPWQDSTVEEDPAESRDPAASWSGGRLVTVFEDLRSGQARLRLSEFDGDGTATTADRELTPGADAGARPALAWGGRRWGLAFLQGSPRRPVWTLLGPGGARLLREAPLGSEEQAAAPEAVISPAWGGGFALAWLSPAAGDLAVRLRLFDEEGATRGAAVEVAAAAPGRHDLAVGRSAEGYLLAWAEPSAAGADVLVAAAVDRDLAPLAAPDAITTEGGAPDGLNLVFTGSETVAIFRDLRDGGRYRPFRLRLGADAGTLGPATPLGSDRDTGPPAASWTGSGVRVSWSLPAAADTETVRTAIVDCAAAAVAAPVRNLAWLDKTTLTWDPVEAAVYDLVSGDLAELAATGDFSAAVDHCEADDLPQTQATVPDRQLPRFYLVRAVVAGTPGSWNADAPGTPDRDPSIAASPTGCP